MRPVVQHDPARPQFGCPLPWLSLPQRRIGELTRALNRRAHRQVKGSHHAVAARIKSAAQDPISNAGKAVRHRSVVVRRD